MATASQQCRLSGFLLGRLAVISIAFLRIGLPFRGKSWYDTESSS